MSEDSATLKLVVNPLVDWIWFGFMLLAFGTGIALLPETVLAPIAARVTAGAPARGSGVAGLLLFLAIGLVASNRAWAAPLKPVEVQREVGWFGANLRCMCAMGGRGCGHMLEDCGAECGGAPETRKEILAFLQQGKSRQEIIDIFIKRHGGAHVLGAPPDSGFNRLAWALPYGLGVAGAGVLAFTAWRLSKRNREDSALDKPDAVDASLASDRERRDGLEDRLDDELSRLDP